MQQVNVNVPPKQVAFELFTRSKFKLQHIQTVNFEKERVAETHLVGLNILTFDIKF